MSLFRSEAIAGRRRGLFGEVTVHQPVGLRAITVGFAAFAVATVGVAATATIARKETAKGWVVPEQGMGEIYGTPGALVQSLRVGLGDTVRAGESLGTLSTETYGMSGPVGREERRQVAAQIAEIDAQVEAVRKQGMMDAAKARQQLSTVHSTLASLQRQRSLQESQLALARRQYDHALPLVAKGFVSQFDQDRRQQAVLSAQQGIGATDQQIEGQRAQLVPLRAAANGALTQAVIDQSRLRASRAGLQSSDMEIATRSGSTLRAPLAGTVAAINTKPGETTRIGLPVITIAPSGQLGIELLLPTRSAGFVAVGQNVRIVVDAFPFQRYGALLGRVEQVNRVTVLPGQYAVPIPVETPSYRVFVRFIRKPGEGSARNLTLKPGMTVTATIVTGRNSLISWLFYPFITVSEKLNNNM